MNLRDFKNSSERRSAVEKGLGIRLQNIGSFILDESTASIKNCENMIGATQLPLGLAGPIKIKGSTFEDEFFLPIATTEGALVASISRGAKAITESGGANSFAYRVGQTRGPVFYVDSLKEQKEVFNWIKKSDDKLKKAAEGTSRHLKFKKAKVKSLSNYIFVRFYFDTKDAMGMNMATIATQALCELIEKETPAKIIAVAGNFDIDKKPAWINFINNRGYKVWSEAIISKEVLEKTLKTTAEKFFDVWLSKCMIGSAMSGSLGFNAQYANIIASMFIATGQDPAHVVDGSLGITTAKVLKNGDLHVSVYLPALSVGTIGGGTSLATQSEALNILRVKGEGNAEKFAEIIGAAVLAGEISLLSSLSEGTLAKAHERLGRAPRSGVK